MGVIVKGIPRGCQGLFTPVSLGYLLSVFNKNSTLKEKIRRVQTPAGGADQWVLKRREHPGVTIVNENDNSRACIPGIPTISFQ